MNIEVNGDSLIITKENQEIFSITKLIDEKNFITQEMLKISLQLDELERLVVSDVLAEIISLEIANLAAKKMIFEERLSGINFILESANVNN